MIRIHGSFPFDRGGKARWLLSELGVPFENRWLNTETKENESPEFLRLNPMGRIPVMEMNDTAIFESGAICSYLADRYIDKGIAPALSSPERAKYQQWMYFAASTMDAFQPRIMIIEDIPAGALRTEKEGPLLDEVKDTFNTLSLALEKDSFLVGNRFTAADICIGYNLYWCALWPEFNSIMVTFPKVTSYLERLKKMPSAIQAKVFSYEN